MRKFRWICLILCLMLVMQWTVLPALGTETTGETTEATTEEPTGETSGEATGEVSGGATVPGKINPADLPQVTGDASVEAGPRTVDGKVPLTASGSQAAQPKTAKAAFLYERNTGTILYALNPDTKMYPASLTKVMTCLLVLENLTDMDEELVVTDSALSGLDPDGSSVNLEVGEVMTVEDLLYCLVVASANDAAAVLAERVAGSEADFVEMMNTRAQELGCTGTHFTNPHGLHDDNHYTTARDLARITLAANELEEFRKLDGTAHHVVPATNTSDARELYTTNFMLSDEQREGFYDSRVTGGKTGYTSKAGRCLVCTAENEKLSLLVVVLGTQEEVLEDGYTITYYGSFEEAGALLDFGFDQFEKVQVTLAGQSLGQFEVSRGENSVVGGPEQEIQTILPVGYNQADITWQCEPDSILTAPIKIGQAIGSCRVWYQDRCVAQTGLVSLSQSAERLLGEDIFTASKLEKQNLGNILKIAAIVFLCLVAVLAVIAGATAIRNAVIRRRRRRRRTERNAAKRRNGKDTNRSGRRR